MAAGRVLRVLPVFLIFLIILKSFQAHVVGKSEIRVSSAQLCDFYVGKCTSTPRYEIFDSNIKNHFKMASISKAKQLTSLLAYAKLALMAELNFSLLMSCGDILSNPGPSTTTLNALKLPFKGLRFGHWNVNYLTQTKFEQIKMQVISPNGTKNLDILVLSETFFNSKTTEELYHIPGFDLLRKDRNSSGGGILIYANSDLNIKRRTDLEDRDLEALWLQVCPLTGRHLSSTQRKG